MTDQRAPPDAMIAALPATERQETAAAYGKLLRKETLSHGEQSALARFEKQREERLRWQYYGSIPKKHWQQMSGRQVKVINEQAARYGLPIGGPTIDLAEFVRAFHDFLASNAQRLAQEEDPLLRSGSSPALEWYREDKARIAQLDRLERERQLVSLRGVEQFLGWFADSIRHAGELICRQFGNEAGDILVDVLDNCQRELEEKNGSFGRPLVGEADVGPPLNRQAPDDPAPSGRNLRRRRQPISMGPASQVCGQRVGPK